MQFELIAQTRTLQGTSASRRLRRASKVPGIVYGGEGVPQSIEVEHNDILLKLKKEAMVPAQCCNYYMYINTDIFDRRSPPPMIKHRSRKTSWNGISTRRRE